MTRVKISFGILIALLGVSIFSGIWVSSRCSAMLDTVSEVQELQGQGDLSAAAEKARQLHSDWESFRRRAAVLLKNNKLSDIDRICERTVRLTESGEPDCLAEAAELQKMIEALRHCEVPFLTSIL